MEMKNKNPQGQKNSNQIPKEIRLKIIQCNIILEGHPSKLRK